MMPLFISFEGPDGSGKSTQVRLLVDALRDRGCAIRATREPGGTPLGERLRPLLLSPEAPPASPLAMALLLSASRAQLLSEVILPALGEGNIVVTDRYADSTVAYQSFGLGLDLEVVRDLTAIATNGVRPDVAIYVDIEPQIGLSRIARRGAENRLDQETLAFHERVREGYLQLIKEEPGRWIVVDGNAQPEEVHRAIMVALDPLLERAEVEA